MNVLRRTAATMFVLLLIATPGRAQQPTPLLPLAVEALVSVSNTSEAVDDPFVFLDATATVRLGRGFDAIVRPYAHRLPGGTWSAQMYQLQLRYQSPTAIPIRVDAGIISSPLGLATLELRQDLNPTVGPPFYYFTPLPSFDGSSDRVRLLTGGYPIGAMVSASGGSWDARAGVTDETPTRKRHVFESDGPSTALQLIAGGGFTPRPGLRIGAGFGKGPYRRTGGLGTASSDGYTEVTVGADEQMPPSTGNRHATVLNLEAEFAFGYTRLSAEWIRDRFETDSEPAVARGFYVQAVQTITPRVFAATRLVRVSTPVFRDATRTPRTSGSYEATVGYRISPDLTLRGGYETSRWFTSSAWNHAAAASVVWARRWF